MKKTTEEVQRYIQEYVKSKFKVKGDGNNFGVIYGLNEEAVCKMLEEVVINVSDRIEQNGETVTKAIIEEICEVLHYDMLCAITQLTDNQKASEESIKEAISQKFGALSEKWDDFAKHMQELGKNIPDLQYAIEQLNSKFETQVLEINSLKGVVEKEGNNSAARDRETQKMISDMSGKLDYLLGLIQKVDVKTDEDLRATLPQNNDFNLGWQYYCSGEYSEALKYLYRAASTNHFWAQHIIGCCYYNGDGVEENLNEAAKWFTMSAKSGYSEALKSLGDCYYHGLGVPQDYNSAFKCYSEAANRQNAKAMYDVGDCYEHGVGVERNILCAVEWYRRSADLGDPCGQFALGCCYYFEKGVPKDYRRAADLFFRAANSGHPDAQENYAECLEKGIGGVSIDIVEAIKYYELAAKQGNKDAERSVTRLSLLRKK